MRAIRLEAVHAKGGVASLEAKGATLWIIPLHRIISVRWMGGTTTIRCEDGLVLEADDPDMWVMMEVEKAFERDLGTYTIGDGWRYRYVDLD